MFKVGDTVMVKAETKVDQIFFNKTVRGTVRRFGEDGWIGVEFEENINGHDLRGICPNGYGYFCPPKTLILVKPMNVDIDDLL